MIAQLEHDPLVLAAYDIVPDLLTLTAEPVPDWPDDDQIGMLADQLGTRAAQITRECESPARILLVEFDRVVVNTIALALAVRLCVRKQLHLLP